MARLFADENIPVSVSNELRKQGHDILTIFEAGMANRRVDDESVLAYATSQQRVLITINRRDFIRLHARNPNHAGIIVCTHDSDFEAQAIRINRLLNDTPMLNGKLLRIITNSPANSVAQRGYGASGAAWSAGVRCLVRHQGQGQRDRSAFARCG